MNTNRRRRSKQAQEPQPTRTGNKAAAPNELLWTIIGLLLTIAATFIEAFVAIPDWPVTSWHLPDLYSLGITCQVGAVLLAGSLGGQNAGALSQIAYLILGLMWLPVFGHGGGWSYWQQGSFGYVVGFIPGAWLCGWLALRQRARLETLAFSCLCGLAVIHFCGGLYLAGLSFWRSRAADATGTAAWELFQTAIIQYSWSPLLSQLLMVCCVAVIAYFLRKILFY